MRIREYVHHLKTVWLTVKMIAALFYVDPIKLCQSQSHLAAVLIETMYDASRLHEDTYRHPCLLN